MSTFNETATQRVAKNLKAIKGLMAEVEGRVESTLNTEHFDWGHVGDLARIRQSLNDLLGKEDKDPD